MVIDENQIQAAVYALLTGANICSRRIYDQPPQDRDAIIPPWISLGNTVIDRIDDSSGPGAKLIMTIDIWSEQPGKKEAQSIRKAVGDLLHLRTFTIGNGVNCNCWEEPGNVVEDPESVGWHGIVRLRIEAQT